MKLNNFWHKEPLWQAPVETGAADAVSEQTQPAETAGPDLSFVPADFHTDGKPDLGKFKDHYTALKTAADARPVPPEAYDFAVPADMKFEGLDLPADFAIADMSADPAFQPLYAELGGLLKEIGAPAEAGGKVSTLLARYEAAKYAQNFAAAKAEIEAEAVKLGPTADTRIATVQTMLAARLPAEQAKALQGLGRSADAIKALETLLGPNSTTPIHQPNAEKNPLASRYPSSVAS